MFEERPDGGDIAINLIAFQAAWLALVVGAANGYALAAQAFALAVIALHLWRSPAAGPEALLIASSVVIGGVVESLLVRGDFVTYAAEGPIAGWPPSWLLLMWAVFASLLNVTFRSFRAWTVAAAVAGCAGVPMAYFVGARLGAMEMPEPYIRSLSAIGLGWAIALPVLFLLAKRLDGWHKP